MRLEEDKGSPACSCRAGTTSYSLCLEARQESQLKCLDTRLREARGSQFSLDVLQSLTLAKLMPAPARSCSRMQSCVLESCLAVTSVSCGSALHIPPGVGLSSARCCRHRRIPHPRHVCWSPSSHLGRPTRRSLAFRHPPCLAAAPAFTSYKKSSLCHLELSSAASAHPGAAAAGAGEGTRGVAGLSQPQR